MNLPTLSPDLTKVPEIFTRPMGTWKGEYIKTDKHGQTQDDALITFMETMTLLDDTHRVRSTQAFKDGVFDGIRFIEEIRC